MIGFGNEARDIRDPMRPQQSSAPTGNTIPMSSATSPTVSPSPTSISTPSAAPQSKVAILGPTLRFKGELSAEEDFILQGSLEGSISNPQCVTIGTDGTVVGDIRARIITIDGTIEGDLYGDESVVVHQSGRVTGNIFAPRVGIVEGAYFNGRIEMARKPAVVQAAPVRATIPSELVPGVPMSPEETEKVLANK